MKKILYMLPAVLTPMAVQALSADGVFVKHSNNNTRSILEQYGDALLLQAEWESQPFRRFMQNHTPQTPELLFKDFDPEKNIPLLLEKDPAYQRDLLWREKDRLYPISIRVALRDDQGRVNSPGEKTKETFKRLDAIAELASGDSVYIDTTGSLHSDSALRMSTLAADIYKTRILKRLGG